MEDGSIIVFQDVFVSSIYFFLLYYMANAQGLFYLCTQESLMAELGNNIRILGSFLSQLHASQASFLVYYLQTLLFI